MLPIHAFIINLIFCFIYTLIFTFFIKHNIDEETTESHVVEEVVETDIDEDEEVEEQVRMFRQSMNNMQKEDLLRDTLMSHSSVQDVFSLIRSNQINFMTSVFLAIEAKRIDLLTAFMENSSGVCADDLLDFVNASIRNSFIDGLRFFYNRLNIERPDFCNHIDRKVISIAARDGFVEGLDFIWNTENEILRSSIVYYANKHRLVHFLRNIHQPFQVPVFFGSKPENLQVRWDEDSVCPILGEVLDDPEDVVCCTSCGNGFAKKAIVDMFAFGRENCPLGCDCREYCTL